MKNLILILCSLVIGFSVAHAEKAEKTEKKAKSFSRQYGLAGCGLGSVIIGKNGGQIFAATTNGSTSNQWFGISAGTLNCVDSPSSQVAQRMDQFILVNRSQLQGDVARGQGETIAALGTYMGCSADVNAVGSVLKANYSTIFVEKAQANEVTDNVISVILSNPDLAKACGSLG